MNAILRNTIGGLGPSQYFRHFFFGAVVAVVMLFIAFYGGATPKTEFLVMVIVNTLLYPYSRYVYEGIVNFVLGDNMFLVNTENALLMKLFTIALCWVLAIFVAPVGLAYLYYAHSKTTR